MASGCDFPDTVDLTSPKNVVDQSTKDRTVVQEELERRLKCRVDREELVKKNILPDLMTSPKLYTQTQQLQRAKIADNLQKKLRNRAEKSNLMQMNILPDLHNNIDPGLQAKQLQLRKSKLADTLNLKLASRPGPLELIKGGILEPRNPELMAAVESVPFESTSQGMGRPAIPEISLHSSSTSEGRPSHRHSVAGTTPTTLRMDVSPPKDVTSPLSDSARSPRKFSDSSLSPAHSPSELYDETRSPTKSPQGFTSSYPPLSLKGTATVVGNHIGKAPSPSQIRKKQQKQQRYRKLRYHEYVPPSKTNSKGGKTTPKSTLKADTPYNLLLQQQQLFLQLQVLQQQYPNGVLMQKLPDLINTLEPGKKGRGSGANPPCDVVKMAPGPSIPPVLQVEQPNKYNTSTVRLDELKVSDLKAACKELGMIVSGKKVELVERLLDNNKGVLPAIALPDAQARDARRLTYSTSHTSSLESQVSGTSVVSPSSPSLSPIFQFPGENHGSSNGQQQSTNGQVAAGARQDPIANLSPLAAPQVFPASNLQAQFDEMVERQKRSYISQKGPKSLAPRPELNDMLAIKFPYPAVDQQPKPSSSKGGTLPHRSDSKPQFSFTDKQSRSLPSSPRAESPADGAASLISDLMDDTPAPDIKQESQPSCSGSEGQSTSISNTFLVSSAVPVSVAVSNAAMHMQMQMAGSNSTASAQIGMGAVPSHSGFYPLNKPMRPMRSSVPVTTMPHKVHPINPPSYPNSSPMMQRSMSLSAAPPMHHVGMGGGPPRMMSSYSTDVPDILPSSGDMRNLVTSEEALTPMDMETEYKDQHLTDLFDILSGDGSNFNPNAQPHSLALHYGGGKLGGRQDSTQSDSIMFGGSGVQFGNPHLGPQHKSGSDLCLLPPREVPKPIPIGNSSYTGNSNMMLVNELGWLDLDNSSAVSLSPTMNAFAGLNHSNPGSLPHEQFHLNFLDEAQGMKSSNPTLSSLGSHPGEMHSFLEPSIHHQGLFPPSDESALVAELGLSS